MSWTTLRSQDPPATWGAGVTTSRTGSDSVTACRGSGAVFHQESDGDGRDFLEWFFGDAGGERFGPEDR